MKFPTTRMVSLAQIFKTGTQVKGKSYIFFDKKGIKGDTFIFLVHLGDAQVLKGLIYSSALTLML